MNENNENLTAKTKANENSREKTNPPAHRQFASAHLGSGVFVIVLVEVLLHDNANTAGFKMILALGIAWLSYWVYAELRYRGHIPLPLARMYACFLALALSITAIMFYIPTGSLRLPKRSGLGAAPSIIALPSPSSLENKLKETQALIEKINATPTATPVPPPPPTTFAKVSPQDVTKLIKAAPPFQRNTVAGGFIGTPVQWTLPYAYADPSPNGQVRVVLDIPERGFVSMDVPLSGNEFLQSTKQGTIITVRGYISQAHEWGIELSSAALTPQ